MLLCSTWLQVRDERGLREELRERILAYKRKDLQAMLMGDAPRPMFGVVVCTDMDRGQTLYEEEHYESRMLSTYLPAPMCGLFGGGQIAPFNESHRVMENVCVAGILRASPPRLRRMVDSELKQQQEGQSDREEQSSEEEEDPGGDKP